MPAVYRGAVRRRFAARHCYWSSPVNWCTWRACTRLRGMTAPSLRRLLHLDEAGLPAERRGAAAGKADGIASAARDAPHKAAQPRAMAAALEIAGQAVALAPRSATAQVRLAELMAATGRWSEALKHDRAADVLVRTVRPELQDAGLAPRIAADLTSAKSHLAGGSEASPASR